MVLLLSQGTPSAGRRLPQQSEVFSSARAVSQSLEANCTTSDSLSELHHVRSPEMDRKIMGVNVCHISWFENIYHYKDIIRSQIIMFVTIIYHKPYISVMIYDDGL